MSKARLLECSLGSTVVFLLGIAADVTLILSFNANILSNFFEPFIFL